MAGTLAPTTTAAAATTAATASLVGVVAIAVLAVASVTALLALLLLNGLLLDLVAGIAAVQLGVQNLDELLLFTDGDLARASVVNESLQVVVRRSRVLVAVVERFTVGSGHEID